MVSLSVALTIIYIVISIKLELHRFIKQINVYMLQYHGNRSSVISLTIIMLTSQCGRSVIQVLVVRVDIEVLTYGAMTPQCGSVSGSGPGCQSGYRSGDL